MDTRITPPERFDELPDFPYEPASVTVDGLEMAYIDEAGPAGSGETFPASTANPRGRTYTATWSRCSPRQAASWPPT